MTRFGYSLTILVAALAAPACTGGVTGDDSTDPTPTTTSTPPTGSTSGDQSTTFDHDNSGISPWDLIDRLEKEGPPKYTSHVHSCPKVRVATLGNILTSVGVNVSDTTALSAGDLYASGTNALGASNYANRIRENISITTSGASREFDIFAAAAPEIIANISTVLRCQTAGVGVELFDGNSCRVDGITCLIGAPAQAEHLDLCNLSISQASDVDLGKRLAVAALMAAAYTCE
jgi:hypothetical protein